MKSPEGQEYKTISPFIRVGRTFFSLAISPFLRKEVIRKHPNDGLSRLEQLAQQGYGSLIIGNHLSLGEPPRVLGITMMNPVLGDREIVSSIGIQQLKGYYKLAARITGVTICPISNKDTLEYIQKHPEKAERYEQALTKKGAAKLLSEYLTQQAPRVLNSGGSVLLYPQGGRRSSLEGITDAVSTLINRTNRYGIDKFAIMFTGAGIRGIKRYDDKSIRGLNLGSVYELTIGRTLTKAELLEEASERGIGIDQFVLEELRLVVPKSYLPRDFAITP